MFIISVFFLWILNIMIIGSKKKLNVLIHLKKNKIKEFNTKLQKIYFIGYISNNNNQYKYVQKNE